MFHLALCILIHLFYFIFPRHIRLRTCPSLPSHRYYTCTITLPTVFLIASQSIHAKTRERKINVCDLFSCSGASDPNRVDLENPAKWIFTCKNRLRYGRERALQGYEHIVSKLRGCFEMQIAESSFRSLSHVVSDTAFRDSNDFILAYHLCAHQRHAVRQTAHDEDFVTPGHLAAKFRNARNLKHRKTSWH